MKLQNDFKELNDRMLAVAKQIDGIRDELVGVMCGCGIVVVLSLLGLGIIK